MINDLVKALGELFVVGSYYEGAVGFLADGIIAAALNRRNIRPFENVALPVFVFACKRNRTVRSQRETVRVPFFFRNIVSPNSIPSSEIAAISVNF